MKLAGFDANVKEITFGPKGRLYVLTHAGAPRGKIVALPARRPSLQRATVVVPEGKDAISFGYEFGPRVVATS